MRMIKSFAGQQWRHRHRDQTYDAFSENLDSPSKIGAVDQVTSIAPVLTIITGLIKP